MVKMNRIMNSIIQTLARGVRNFDKHTFSKCKKMTICVWFYFVDYYKATPKRGYLITNWHG